MSRIVRTEQTASTSYLEPTTVFDLSAIEGNHGAILTKEKRMIGLWRYGNRERDGGFGSHVSTLVEQPTGSQAAAILQSIFFQSTPFLRHRHHV